MYPWFRGRISFIARFLLPASLGLAGIIHAERLSRFWEGAAASTFHNKYLFKRPGVQARFSLPRRLLTDDLKNCFPLTDRGIQHRSLLSSPCRKLGESCGLKCHRLPPAETFTPVTARLPYPPTGQLAASQGGKSILGVRQWDAFSQQRPPGTR